MLFYFGFIALIIVLVFIYFFSPIEKIKHRIEIKKKQVQDEREKVVFERSERLQRLLSLNNDCFFYRITNNRVITISCQSINELNTIDLRDAFIENLTGDLPAIRDMIRKIEYNKSQYLDYIKEYDSIVRYNYSIDSKNYAEFDYFNDIERSLVEQLRKTPTTDQQITVQAKYHNVFEKKEYNRSRSFDVNEIKECCAIAESLVPNQSSTQIERNLMTNSLRYNIMKRDGFRCVLCGASANDGAKLHVDHIFPVSKGGKTEPNNLRTLCESCNRGKGAKYDFNGVN